MTRSEHFAAKLQLEFQRQSASTHFGEIALFRVLQGTFGSLRPMFHVEEYHGNKHQIHFATSQPWLKPRARCELCDLLLITYSSTGDPQVRLMLLQAKLSRVKHSGLCSPSGMKPNSTRFQADYVQWDLLSSRPRLEPTNSFKPPPELLRSALVPSIGAFGVFHRADSGLIDMFYASADTLQPVGSPTGKAGRLCTNVSPPLRHFSGFADIPQCCCLFTFGKALFDLQLGTPVVGTTAKGDRMRDDILARFAATVLTAHLHQEGANSVLIPEVLRLLEHSPEHAKMGGSAPNVVILQGDAPQSMG
ncbi:hypothetical protein GSY71_13615 [Pusillimonas sp. TS35]|nr:hypothetical protein [Pusillimonas sp. TS35]